MSQRHCDRIGIMITIGRSGQVSCLHFHFKRCKLSGGRCDLLKIVEPRDIDGSKGPIHG